MRRVQLLCTGILLMGTAAPLAQAAQPAPADRAIPPNFLTGDRGAEQPKPGVAFVPFVGGGPPPWERGPMARGPSLELALAAAQQAMRTCDADAHMPTAVAVVDSVGQPRALLAEDGRRGWHIYSATRKALTAAAFGVPSSASAAKAAKPENASRLKPSMTTLPGAVPLKLGGQTIGAIGVSGTRSGEQDEACAAAGASAIAARLK